MKYNRKDAQAFHDNLVNNARDALRAYGPLLGYAEHCVSTWDDVVHDGFVKSLDSISTMLKDSYVNIEAYAHELLEKIQFMDKRDD